jgi:hypothetical protein
MCLNTNTFVLLYDQQRIFTIDIFRSNSTYAVKLPVLRVLLIFHIHEFRDYFAYMTVLCGMWLYRVAVSCGCIVWLYHVAVSCGCIMWPYHVVVSCDCITWLYRVAVSRGRIVWLYRSCIVWLYRVAVPCCCIMWLYHVRLVSANRIPLKSLQTTTLRQKKREMRK